MRFLPQGDGDLETMLRAVGVSSVEALFESIPAALRLRGDLNLPAPQSELELRARLGELAAANASTATHPCFLGAGAYNHYIPSAVWQILLRSEFYTSYTPYQPEISQGTLQATFEFQSLIAALTEMDVANASLYDGGSALAEAVLLAHRANRRRVLVASEAIHPHYLRVVRSYVRHLGVELRTVPVGADGRTDAAALGSALESAGGEAMAVALQSPNFFGCVEDLATAGAAARTSGALFLVAVSDPISLGLLRGPGRYGADVVVGEGHSLGTPLQFGGPYLGFMAARESLVRAMPGRLVGEARDGQGRRGYVLTLSTREQHIRREKATSNICTNQGLIATAAAIYMSLMGRQGMREVAAQCHSKAEYARQRIAALRGFRPRFEAASFHEFVIDLPADAGKVSERLLAQGLLGGLALGPIFPSMSRSMLFCVTEMNTREQIDRLCLALGEAAS